MKRVVGAVVVWLVLVGGVGLYVGLRSTPSVRALDAMTRFGAEGRWVVEVTASFLPEPDPFQAAAATLTTEPAVVVLCNGRVVPAGSGSPLRRPLAGLLTGRSEILADVSPPASEGGRAHAVRLRVLCDGTVVAETTAWSAPGARVVTSVVVNGVAP